MFDPKQKLEENYVALLQSEGLMSSEFEEGEESSVITVICGGRTLSVPKVSGKYKTYLFLTEMADRVKEGTTTSGNALFVRAKGYYGTDWAELLRQHESNEKSHDSVAFFAALEGVVEHINFNLA
jgi:hypothetical protein